PAPPALYVLSLHDALPILPEERHRIALLARLANHAVLTGSISATGKMLQHIPAVHDQDVRIADQHGQPLPVIEQLQACLTGEQQDRKSTRLNSSHVKISYA